MGFLHVKSIRDLRDFIATGVLRIVNQPIRVKKKKNCVGQAKVFDAYGAMDVLKGRKRLRRK
jgi:hypothetical protein